MKFKKFGAMQYDWGTQQAISVDFGTWRHGVRMPTGCSPETVADGLRQLADAIEHASANNHGNAWTQV